MEERVNCSKTIALRDGLGNPREMSNLDRFPRLLINERPVSSPFGLLGFDENALTFALGYTFQQSPTLLIWFLKHQHVAIPGVNRPSLRRGQITLQHHQNTDPNSGITDIEIKIPGRCHVIIEAKIGMAVPTIEQLLKYMDRLDKSEEPAKKLISLVQTHDDSHVSVYQKCDPRLKTRFQGFRWADFFQICVEILTSEYIDQTEKDWVRSFYAFLDQEYAMQAYSAEVWILPVETTTPLWPGGKTFWDIHKQYRVYWDRVQRTVRPIYLAFRAEGKVESIHRVNKIEHERPLIDLIPELKAVKEKWPSELWTVWHFDPPVSLPNAIQTGRGMYSRRVRSHLDLLLSCKTVLEIEKKMAERRE